jgi:uncharacterized protein YukE
MKYIATFLLLISSFAFADDSLVLGSISGAVQMLHQADVEGAALGQAKLQIQQQADTLQTEKNAYEANNKSITEEVAQFTALHNHNESWGASVIPEVDRYNATCTGTGDQNYVNRCNAWKAQLAPIRDAYNASVQRELTWKDNLQPKVNAVIAEHQHILNEFNRLQALAIENEKQGQAYLAKRAQIIREITELVNNFNTQCQTAIDSGNKELASETCGQAFDGNAIHQIHIPDLPSPQWTAWGATANDR